MLLRIPWIHHYHRKKIYVKVSETIANELHVPSGAIYPYRYQWRLYDGKRLVYMAGVYSTKTDEKSKQMADRIDQIFFQRMSDYIGEHQYFNIRLWIRKYRHPVPVFDEL